MLTKNLIRTRSEGNGIRPLFLKTQDKKTIEFCQSLLETATNCVGELKSALEEELSFLCTQSPLPPLAAQGLAHLVLENAQTKEEPRADKMAFRAALFTTANQLLQEGCPDYLTYQHAISLSQNMPFSQLAQDLYSDLQSFARVESFKDSFGPQQLIHRYNCAQVQGLLLKAEVLELHIPNHTTQQVRHLLRYVKFFQLICSSRSTPLGLHLTIDGPASILGLGPKYGLKLAQFFPCVLSLPTWHLKSKVLITGGVRKDVPKDLTLDHTCGIRSHYPPTCRDLPSDITHCLETLGNKNPDWSIQTENAPPVLLPNGELLVPDFCLEHKNGQKICVEVFQEWQTGAAIRRIQTLVKHPQNYILLALPIKLKNLKTHMDITKTNPYPWAVLYRKTLLADPIAKAAQALLKPNQGL